MVKHVVQYLGAVSGGFIGEITYTGISPYVPQIGSMVAISGYTLKVKSVTSHILQQRIVVYVE